ncbi:MAG: sulfatase-like hydrolase/transferase [Clostridia bacterium]|nr:sulfatase-like hydrolase/transferase [Clostridia bacterium]
MAENGRKDRGGMSGAGRPNVLFIFTDQQRRDTISALGNPFIVTPAPDSIATAPDTYVFDRCYTPSPVCVPARLAMFAGQYCSRTGNNNNNAVSVYEGEGFFKRFTDAGYDTCCIGKMHYRKDPYGPMGFRRRLVQEEMADPRDDYMKWLRGTPYRNVFDYNGQRTELYYIPQVSQLPSEAHPTQWIGDRAVEFINGTGRSGEPFFLFASFIHPHPPFAPPSPWNKMYRSRVSPAFVPEDEDSYRDLLRNRYTLDALAISPRRRELLVQHYYACVSFVDYQIGRIVAALKERGLYENTIIVFSSDHGELLGDYRSMGKRTMLDAASNIPLLIRVPGCTGGIRHDPASLVDMAPTLLSACGIGYPGGEFDGVDLMSGRHDLVFSQYESGPAETCMAASGTDKLVWSAIGGRYFYFDSFPDGKDRFDLSLPRVRELKERLDAYMASDRCPAPTEGPARKSPLLQEYGSFYAPLDDHCSTMEEERARMPEGYPITLGCKHTDY